MSGWYRRLWALDEPLDPGLRLLRDLLAPLEWLYGGAVRTRAWAYERGLLRSTPALLPSVGIGNLTVGGTGKTPLTAWLASWLLKRGRAPAVVMRGYGGDEVLVHRVLNPAVPVYASPDRAAGVQRAAADRADCVVLDDAFQHRALRADANVVLVAAEDWTDRRRLLPRGPWREPLDALHRASLLVVTRKTASAAQSEAVAARLAESFPELPVARCRLGLARLARLTGEPLSFAEQRRLDGFHAAFAVAGVAKPETVWRQLEAAGVQMDQRRAFGDHHRYGAAELEVMKRAAASGPLLATLKDAVKLAPLLPADLHLWVPLQEVEWESGAAELEALLERVLGRPRAGG
jgi:tetraacyldisaccharide 4'-kinase